MTDNSNIAITINRVEHTVLCGKCKTPVGHVAKTEPDMSDTAPAIVGCIRCNNTDSAKQVASIAIKYAKDEGQMILNRAMRDAAKDSAALSFKGKTTSNKRYRFMVEL
jgi:hypothetical protein